MTRQRWWDAVELGYIRAGIDVGIYHARFSYDHRYKKLCRISLGRKLTPYEEGIIHGYESAKRKS